MIKLENRVHLAGMILFGLCLVGVLVWFGVSYHNWKARRVTSYGCGSKGSKPLPSGLRRYRGGMDGYAMYLDLEMDPYTKTMGLHQTGTISVCFCGLQTTKCNSSTPCSAYQAKHLPVTYSLDSCTLEIPLSNTCLQTTFSSAFPSVATLQGILYDAPKNVFHIQALGLKVMTENVVLAPVDPAKVWPCASCTEKENVKTFCQ